MAAARCRSSERLAVRRRFVRGRPFAWRCRPNEEDRWFSAGRSRLIMRSVFVFSRGGFRMKGRILWSATGLVIAAVVSVGSTTMYGQSAASAQAFTPPRTADGQPDLQGIWDFRTVTPLERPAE